MPSNRPSHLACAEPASSIGPVIAIGIPFASCHCLRVRAGECNTVQYHSQQSYSHYLSYPRIPRPVNTVSRPFETHAGSDHLRHGYSRKVAMAITERFFSFFSCAPPCLDLLVSKSQFHSVCLSHTTRPGKCGNGNVKMGMAKRGRFREMKDGLLGRRE
jgi:hypothetical protein